MFRELILLLQGEQNAASISSPADYINLSQEALQDLFSLKHQARFSPWQIELNFLQFFVASGPFIFLDTRGEYASAHDWFNYCLADTYPAALSQQVEIKRISDFFTSSNDALHEVLLQIIIPWISALFHYSRVQNALREVAQHLLPFCCALLQDRINSAVMASNSEALEEYANTAVMVGNWVDHYDSNAADPWANYLEYLYTSVLPSSSRSRIAVGFATKLGRRTNKDPVEWARLALAEHASSLLTHERLQLLCMASNSIDVARHNMEEIRREIECVRDDVFAGADRSDAKTCYHLDRLFGFLNPVIKVAAESGDAKFLYVLLATWYGVAIERRRTTSPAFILPGIDGSIVYVSEQRAALLHSGEKLTIEEMTIMTNEALGTLVTVQGAIQRFESIPVRPGVPSSSAANDFFDSCRIYYCLKEDANAILAILADARAIVLVPWAQHPIQSLIYHTLGRTFPVAVSLQQPADDRKIRRVQIWAPNQTFSECFEVDAITCIFESSGVEVRVCANAEARSKEQFIQAYKDTSFDVFWVISHGDFNHWSPHSATIVLSTEDQSGIGIGDLSSLSIDSSSDGRRLLVLNVCDGAASAMVGGLNKLGFAQALACRNQAVISHLWPVEPVYAAVFGACLALGLTKSDCLFTGYERTLSLLQGDSRELVNELQGAGLHKLVEHLNTRDYRFNSSIHTWGSAIFFE